MLAIDLNRATVQCVHFVQPSEVPDISEIRKLGLHVAVMAAQSIKTQEDLFTAIAEAMNFPEYFGKNWDALEECLRDLEWISAKGYVLIIHHANQFWQRAPKFAG